MQFAVYATTVNGVQNSPVDLDVFNGNTTALNSLIGSGSGSASSPTIGSSQLTGSTFTLTAPSQVGFNYVLEYKNSMSDPNWIPVQTNGGNGAMINLTNTGATGPSRFYHIRVQ
jgi:hypothetical protein